MDEGSNSEDSDDNNRAVTPLSCPCIITEADAGITEQVNRCVENICAEWDPDEAAKTPLLIDPETVKQMNATLAEVMSFINMPDRTPRRSFLTLGTVVHREMATINARIDALKGYLDGSIPLEDPRTQEELTGQKKV